MKVRILKAFTNIWLSFATLFILVCLLMVAITSSGFFDAWQRISAILGPFNIVNWVVTCFTFSPAFISWLWLEKIEQGETMSTQKQITMGLGIIILSGLVIVMISFVISRHHF